VRPMNFFAVLTDILSFLPLALQAGIAFVIFKRKLLKAFPFFFCLHNCGCLPGYWFDSSELPKQSLRFSVLVW